MLLRVWSNHPYRATRDLDLLRCGDRKRRSDPVRRRISHAPGLSPKSMRSSQRLRSENTMLVQIARLRSLLLLDRMLLPCTSTLTGTSHGGGTTRSKQKSSSANVPQSARTCSTTRHLHVTRSARARVDESSRTAVCPLSGSRPDQRKLPPGDWVSRNHRTCTPGGRPELVTDINSDQLNLAFKAL